ncbi:MAG: rhodanese-like domain-containing protein [Rhodococcus sp. (in: high G+C Gram-positive bacteria)]
MTPETPDTPAEVNITTFIALNKEGLTVVDVREEYEFAAGHVPHAQHIPLDELSSRLDQIGGPDPVYLICASGNRSLKAARIIAAAGRDAVSVVGGTKAWVDSEQPTERAGNS